MHDKAALSIPTDRCREGQPCLPTSMGNGGGVGIDLRDPARVVLPPPVTCSHMALDRLLQWANVVYIARVALAAVATLAIYHLSARVTAAKDRELERYRTESTLKIATAQAEAAQAVEIAESERLARAELESQVGAAEVRAAEANAVAAQAQLELAKLREPRTIAPEDQEEIIAALEGFTGQNFGFSVFPDPESLALLRVLNAVLTSSGWQRVPSQIGAIVVNAAGNTAGTSHDSGVSAFVAPDNLEAEARVIALCRALTNAGIPCQPSRTEQLRGKDPKAIVINVGKKP